MNVEIHEYRWPAGEETTYRTVRLVGDYIMRGGVRWDVRQLALSILDAARVPSGDDLLSIGVLYDWFLATRGAYRRDPVWAELVQEAQHTLGLTPFVARGWDCDDATVALGALAGSVGIVPRIRIMGGDCPGDAERCRARFSHIHVELSPDGGRTWVPTDPVAHPRPLGFRPPGRIEQYFYADGSPAGPPLGPGAAVVTDELTAARASALHGLRGLGQANAPTVRLEEGQIPGVPAFRLESDGSVWVGGVQVAQPGETPGWSTMLSRFEQAGGPQVVAELRRLNLQDDPLAMGLQVATSVVAMWNPPVGAMVAAAVNLAVPIIRGLLDGEEEPPRATLFGMPLSSLVGDPLAYPHVSAAILANPGAATASASGDVSTAALSETIGDVEQTWKDEITRVAREYRRTLDRPRSFYRAAAFVGHMPLNELRQADWIGPDVRDLVGLAALAREGYVQAFLDELLYYMAVYDDAKWAAFVARDYTGTEPGRWVQGSTGWKAGEDMWTEWAKLGSPDDVKREAKQRIERLVRRRELPADLIRGALGSISIEHPISREDLLAEALRRDALRNEWYEVRRWVGVRVTPLSPIGNLWPSATFDASTPSFSRYRTHAEVIEKAYERAGAAMPPAEVPLAVDMAVAEFLELHAYEERRTGSARPTVTMDVKGDRVTTSAAPRNPQPSATLDRLKGFAGARKAGPQSAEDAMDAEASLAALMDVPTTSTGEIAVVPLLALLLKGRS